MMDEDLLKRLDSLRIPFDTFPIVCRRSISRILNYPTYQLRDLLEALDELIEQ